MGENVTGFKPCFREETKAMGSTMTVKALLMADGCTWNWEMVCNLFMPESAAAILKQRVEGVGAPDKLIWTLSSIGEYSVKSMYNYLVGQRSGGVSPLAAEEWRDLWKLTVHA